jgi:hypothetical protein
MEFFGKYRGKVVNNTDPLALGRLQVQVPAVLGAGRMSWALPCVPFAGRGIGFFALPPVGANVWVEFEAGDPDFPIWTGCFWGQGEIPALPPIDEIFTITTANTAITLTDTPGAASVKLELKSPPVTLTIGEQGIELVFGAKSIKLTQASVSVNDGALEVL